MNRKQVLSWCLFDFANSSYSAVIAAVVFQVYYINRIVGNGGGRGDLWWGASISVSMLFVSLSSPFLGGIADYGGLRKRLLAFYTYLCVLAVACFSLLTPGAAFFGFLLIVLANIGMEGGLVFYNSFLPQIAPVEFQGRVSGWGFGVGYAGSILSLLIALPLASTGRFEYIWLMVAIFFSLFSLPAFLFLPRDKSTGVTAAEAGIRGVRNAWTVLREVWSRKEPRKFLLSYLIHEDGVNTVIVSSGRAIRPPASFTSSRRGWWPSPSSPRTAPTSWSTIVAMASFSAGTPVFTGEPYSGGARTIKPTLCHLIPATALQRLHQENPELAGFFTRMVLSRVRSLYSEIVSEQLRSSSPLMEAYPFKKRLSEIMVTSVATCSPEESAQQVAPRMVTRGVGSALVVDEQRQLLGIITERDLVARVVAPQNANGQSLLRRRDHDPRPAGPSPRHLHVRGDAHPRRGRAPDRARRAARPSSPR